LKVEGESVIQDNLKKKKAEYEKVQVLPAFKKGRFLFQGCRFEYESKIIKCVNVEDPGLKRYKTEPLW
jgi:hypothetical protein